MKPLLWKVGELAQQTGLTIRTLHYYDEIGLLTPSHRTESGHRLYTRDDLARLQQIKSLRQLGLSLEEVGRSLSGSGLSALQIVEKQLEQLRQQMALQQSLCRRLEALAQHFRAAESVSVEELIQAIEGMVMVEKYYTPEMLEELKQRRAAFGEEAIRAVEAEWPQLIAQMQAAMQRGDDPASAHVQQLARRWRELVDAFTGGNPAIEQALDNMYRQEPQMAQQAGVDAALFEYVGKAVKAVNLGG